MNEQHLINGGAFMTARKMFTSEVWLKDPIYVKIWIWIYGSANHSDTEKDGLHYARGEIVTTYGEIQKEAMYIRNRKEISPSIKTIRIMLEWFKNKGMINVTPLKSEPCRTGAGATASTGAYVGIKITVINYNIYQNLDNYRGRHKGRHLYEQGHNNNNDYNKNDKNPSEISEKIISLKTRYPDQRIIDQALDAIASTRKGGRIADNVKLQILESWVKHPIESVLSGIRIYLSKRYFQQGKRESYLLAIIRDQNQKQDFTTKSKTPDWY